MTIQVRCYKAANNGVTAVSSIAPGYTGWTAVAPYANTAPVVGDLIVVVGLFALGSGNVTQSAGTGSYTFITANGDANAATEPFTSWCAYRAYASGDTGPTFSWSGTTTAYDYLIFALTSSNADGSVVYDANGTPKVDTSAAAAHTPNTASAPRSNDAAIVLNAARYQTSGSHAITMTTPCSGYSAIHIAGYNGATGNYANSCSAYMDTPAGPGTITPGSETFNEAVANNAYTLLVNELVIDQTGPPLGWSSPAGVRAVSVRTGLAMASQIPSAAPPLAILTASLPGGITGRSYTATLAASGGTLPYTWSISSGSLPAGLSLAPSTGIVSGTPAGPPGAASFTVKVTDSLSNTATQPLSILITAAPVVQSGPARARITPPPRGRTWSNPGGPVRNPVAPPPVHLPHGPVQAKLLPQPRRGRMAADWGVILFLNPQAGPVFTQATAPARARITPPRHGRIASNPGVRVAVPQPAKIYPAQGPVRARVAPPFSKGRISSSRGTPLRNPNTGPAFTQRTAPARAGISFPPRGRTASNPGTPVQNPVPPPAVAAYPQHGPVQAKLPLARRGAARAIRFLPVSGQPQAGPSFQQPARPARIRPSLPPRGRISSNPGVAVFIPPPPAGPVFVPSHQALRAKLPQQPFLRGRVSYNPGSVPRNPNSGPVFIQRSSLPLVRPLPRRGTCRTIKFLPIPVPPPLGIGPPFIQATSPARARITPPPRGRIVSNPGGPVRNPQAGPAFRQAVQPARTRITLPPRGRVSSNPGGPLENPIPPIVAIFFEKTYPIRARIPQNAPRGRVYSHPGAPLRNPGSGPVFRQAVRPVQARFPLPPRGRIASSPGGPVRNPAIPAPAYPLHGPVQARIPQVFSKGRVGSNPGTTYPHVAPFRQATQPARTRITLPPRGRIGGNPGGPLRNPPVPAPVYPLHGPVQARFPLPPRGRTEGNRGAPVRNPQAGPVFRQAVRPIRGIIPQNAPRGRTSSNPGGPVENIPFATLVFSYGSPHFAWKYDDPHFEWTYGNPHGGWSYGIPQL